MSMSTELRITVGQESPATPNTVVSAKELLSRVNRRLYRYGKAYTQKVDLRPDSGQVVTVYALTNNWVNRNAYRMAMKAWLENTKEERAAAGKNTARWLDFQCSHAPTGYSAGKPVVYDRQTLAATTLIGGEHVGSRVAKDDGTEMTFSWTEPGAALKFNLIEEYDKAGRVLQTPEDSETTLAYQALNSDDMVNTIYERVQEDGDLPPYEPDTFSNGIWTKIATLDASDAQRLSTGYFEALCGVIALEVYNGNGDITVCYKPGKYKGVHALDI